MTATPRPPGQQGVVTKQDIDEIVGRLDDAAVAAIVATDASRDELLEAYAWLTADDAQRRRLHRAPSGLVARLCDLLEAEISPPEER